MRFLDLSTRLLLGAVFVLFGASKLYPFMPTPPVAPEASAFVGALVATGYLWQLLGAVEIAGGVLLLSGRLLPVALLLLAPVIANIVPYLLLLAHTGAGIGMSAFLIAAELFLAWRHRKHWTALVRA